MTRKYTKHNHDVFFIILNELKQEYDNRLLLKRRSQKEICENYNCDYFAFNSWMHNYAPYTVSTRRKWVSDKKRDAFNNKKNYAKNYKKNRNKILERRKIYKKNNRSKINESDRRYRKSYAFKKIKQGVKWKEAQRRKRKRSFQRNKENLSDKYIKKLLVFRTCLKYKDIPKELVETKRLQLKLMREVEKND